VAGHRRAGAAREPAGEPAGGAAELRGERERVRLPEHRQLRWRVRDGGASPGAGSPSDRDDRGPGAEPRRERAAARLPHGAGGGGRRGPGRVGAAGRLHGVGRPQGRGAVPGAGPAADGDLRGERLDGGRRGQPAARGGAGGAARRGGGGVRRHPDRGLHESAALVGAGRDRGAGQPGGGAAGGSNRGEEPARPPAGGVADAARDPRVVRRPAQRMTGRVRGAGRAPAPCALAALAAALLAAGCGAAPAGSGEVMFWGMGREGEVVRELVPEFERRNPGNRAHVQQIPWTAAHEKPLTAFVGEATPDVAQVGNTWVPEFVALGALEELGPWVARSAVIREADVFPGIWDTNVVDGRLYGVPWYVDTRVLFYRTDILAEAGYDSIPPTWEG